MTKDPSISFQATTPTINNMAPYNNMDRSVFNTIGNSDPFNANNSAGMLMTPIKPKIYHNNKIDVGGVTNGS
jgi:hypothetical protein